MEELTIIGYGAAGFAATIRANELGITPTLIGYGPLGGTCVNVGCVPSKKVLRIGEEYYLGKKRCKCNEDFLEAFKEEKKLVEEMRKAKYEDVLSSYDVKLIEGKAHFLSPNSIKIGDKIIESKKFIISTGSSPFIPEIKGLKELGYWTNVEALNPDRKIDSLVIIGGRAQALEFSQMYKRLGVDVAILQRSKTLIPDWEPEIALEMKKILEEEGIIVVTDVKIKEVKKGNNKVIITDKGEIEADEILIATGRKPNTDLNLEVAGVKIGNNGGILVNEELMTSNPNIYAAGDVVGGPMLEALAGKEGSVAAENAILGSHKKIDMLSVPQAIFTQPNAAKVGLTSFEAKNFDSRIVKMKDVAKANIIDSKGLIKMIIDKNNKKILGVHILSDNAAEVINEAALSIKMRATVDDIIDTVHVFPTMSESLKLTALSFNRDITKMSCCVD
ncbi:mercury(II) reductase [Acidianus brierleyi]|uniref:Mercuric reductase n=1 Tax=Acidianus brierleyi TaxID=41673 RepID=A0A2U9IIN9_9CREN|nr:mercury(II) reductase [Acidianus brierleyi]AWR95804.1 mercury(II) reductase [Acidianus brierleyi]